ncbi:MAG: LytR C-terminal domain-containing protein [Leptospiraceae bacterium]|nr:LytR C-terminal domain-containing protein [Leptospiraceae bacterium]MDW8307274.1 LytR C-terminal domain-containing protein [Leptospiraceae bacterium]
MKKNSLFGIPWPLNWPFLLSLFIIFSAAAGWLIYHYVHRTVMETLFARQQSFGILVAVDPPNSAEKAQFLSVAEIHPKTSRIGFISFFPETKLSLQEPAIGYRLQQEGEEQLTQKLSQILGVDIPYHVKLSIPTIALVVDLSEGVPYFIPRSEKLPEEEFPDGEFIMDGFLVQKYLKPAFGKNEYAPAFVLFRYYSLFLNFWRHRQQKWNMFQNEEILLRAIKDIKTNLPFRAIVFLLKSILNNKHWLPLFMEIPVKRIGDDFFMDQETSAFYLKNFRRQLTQKENPFLQDVPKMEVKNGTLIPNLARELRGELARKGLSVLEFSNADRHDYSHTLLLDTAGNVFFLESISRMLQLERAYHAVNRSYFTDLVLILGQDYKKMKLES